MDFDGITLVDEAFPVGSGTQQALNGFKPTGITIDHTISIVGELSAGKTVAWPIIENITIVKLHLGFGIAALNGNFSIDIKKNATTIKSITISGGDQYEDILASALTSASFAPGDKLSFTISAVSSTKAAYHFSAQIDYVPG